MMKKIQIDVNEAETVPASIVLTNKLAWYKLEPPGLRPAPRFGHSCGSRENTYYVFGGQENGNRTNSVLALDVHSSRWNLLNCTGHLPSPRSQQCSCILSKYFIVHGGEGAKYTKDEIDPITKALYMSKHSISGKAVNDIDHMSSVISDKGLNPLSGICPGDTLAGKLRHHVMLVDSRHREDHDEDHQPDMEPTTICSLDDFYALDLETKHWHQIHCSLAPLPRKGHTLNVAPLKIADALEDHLIMFGGFCAETNGLSSTVHVCTVFNVLTTLEKYESKRERGGGGILEYAAPVTWRTLPTSGKPPPGRTRHTTCYIDRGQVSQDAGILIVFGGIVGTHFDSSRASNDIYILDLNSHAWVRTHFGPDALSMRMSGMGPPQIYGHSAMAVKTIETNSDGYHRVGRQDMFIFGGSTNVSMSSAGCQNSLYRFNTKDHTWTKLPISNCESPPERYGQTVGVIEGWSPAESDPATSHWDCCAVVFGGSNAVMCPADAWILDLSISKSARDNDANDSNATIVKHIGGLSSHSLQKKMVTSASLPLLHPRRTLHSHPHKSSSAVSLSDAQPGSLDHMSTVLSGTKKESQFLEGDESTREDIDEAFETVRKQEVVANLQLEYEQTRVTLAENREKEMELQIEQLRAKLDEIRTSREKEVSSLRSQLRNSVQTERELKADTEASLHTIFINSLR